MSDLNTIVQVTISRETQAVAIASFGTPAIISEFLTSKTTAAFDRYRNYASLSEMIDDGWEATDDEYKAANIILAQNPKPDKVMIGRLDDVGVGDASITEGLTAIAAASQDWYAWELLPPGTYEDDIKEAALWNETQKKIFFYSSADDDILDPSSTTDLAYFFKNAAYDRTISCYHPNSLDETPTPAPAWFEAGWMGEALPYDPGSQTWAYKTISGVATYALTSGQVTAALAKSANIYTTIGGVNVTQNGTVASGEYIDIIRGLDWLESSLQEAVYAELVNKRKIPYTDEGIALIENTVRGVLSTAATAGLLIESTIVMSVPLLSEISSADKLTRNLPDVTFTADLQGAIHTVTIEGTVTV